MSNLFPTNSNSSVSIVGGSLLSIIAHSAWTVYKSAEQNKRVTQDSLKQLGIPFGYMML